MTSNYYDILQIDKTASEKEIRAGYLKQSRIHHPDKHAGDEEKVAEATKTFQKITRAHEVLSNPKLRDLYDRGGEELLQNDSQHGGMDLNELLRRTMGGMAGHHSSTPQKPPAIQMQYKVSLADFYCGKKESVSFTIQAACKTCQGKGTVDKKDANVCSSCNGAGKISKAQQMAHGLMQIVQVACTNCLGKGICIEESNKCKECSGDRLSNQTVGIDFEIEKGALPGDRLFFPNKGNQVVHKSTILTGDLYIVFEETTSEIKELQSLKRDTKVPCNLSCEKTISLLDSLKGFSFTFAHLDGRQVLFQSPDSVCLANGQFAILENYGMPIKNTDKKYGDLFIKFNVIMPSVNIRKSPKLSSLDSILSPFLSSSLPPIVDTKIEKCKSCYWNAKTIKTKKSAKLNQLKQQYDNGDDNNDDDDSNDNDNPHPQQQCRQM